MKYKLPLWAMLLEAFPREERLRMGGRGRMRGLLIRRIKERLEDGALAEDELATV